MRQRFEDEFLEYKKERNDLIDDLKLKLSYAENELSNLDSFRRDKEYHDRKLATIESTYAQEKADAMFAYDEQERYVNFLHILFRITHKWFTSHLLENLWRVKPIY